MKPLFSLTALSLLATALAMALLIIFPETNSFLPLRIIGSGMHVADTLFHELGHTFFNWLFGRPAIPMIFTLFGADQAGGMSMAWERSMVMQGAALLVLALCLCWCWKFARGLLPFAALFTLIIAALACTKYYNIVILYMGHGSAILVGGWLLYRGWLGLDARNAFERWLNAFFGFFLVLNNFTFAYMLAYDAEARASYMEHTPFGVSHDDFTAICEEMTRWSVHGVALFTLCYCAAVIIGAFLLALMHSEREEDA